MYNPSHPFDHLSCNSCLFCNGLMVLFGWNNVSMYVFGSLSNCLERSPQLLKITNFTLWLVLHSRHSWRTYHFDQCFLLHHVLSIIPFWFYVLLSAGTRVRRLYRHVWNFRMLYDFRSERLQTVEYSLPYISPQLTIFLVTFPRIFCVRLLKCLLNLCSVCMLVRFKL